MCVAQNIRSGESGKSTPFEYGEEYQKLQADKYRNRRNNHWSIRIDLARRLVEEICATRLSNKNIKDIVIADIGCSIGTFAIEFAKLGFQAFGIDSDSRAIEIARLLNDEEKSSAVFIADDISKIGDANFNLIDIAVCFDIFEHLHDDVMGSFLHTLKGRLSKDGCVCFHTYPTQYDYIFHGRPYLKLPLLPFRRLSVPKFNIAVKIYACLIDMLVLLKRGETVKERIKNECHCNMLTEERLADIFERAGYDLIRLDTEELYPEPGMKAFIKQPISHRNLFGIAVPK